MIGKSHVLTQVAISEINMNLWTEESVLQVCRQSLIDGNDEAEHLCNCWIDKAFAAPLSTIKAFLGDSEALHGGTMGEPIIQPDYVSALSKIFWDALADIAKCAAPKYQVLNDDEKTAQAMANYVWHAFIDR